MIKNLTQRIHELFQNSWQNPLILQKKIKYLMDIIYALSMKQIGYNKYRIKK